MTVRAPAQLDQESELIADRGAPGLSHLSRAGGKKQQSRDTEEEDSRSVASTSSLEDLFWQKGITLLSHCRLLQGDSSHFFK